MADETTDDETTDDETTDDVVGVLRGHHARLRALFTRLFSEDDRDARLECHRELRTLVTVHQTCVRLLVRPVIDQVPLPGRTERRTLEEKEAAMLLADLDDIDVCCEEFDVRLAQLESVVLGLARAEESEEFGPLVRHLSAEDRIRMGHQILAAEHHAATEPQFIGPHTIDSAAARRRRAPASLAAIADHAREAIESLAGLPRSPSAP